METSIETRVAVLETKVESMSDDTTEIKADVKQLLEALNKGRGIWLMALAAGTIVTTVVNWGLSLLNKVN